MKSLIKNMIGSQYFLSMYFGQLNNFLPFYINLSISTE